MTTPDLHDQQQALSASARWLVRLRWAAGLTVGGGAAPNAAWVGWSGQHARALAVGLAILVYNVVLYGLVAPTSGLAERRRALLAVSCSQILLDLVCLTLLVLWTGGARSPLLGLFVLHLVFACLLLPRLTSYATVGVSMALVFTGLWLTDQWPAGRPDLLLLFGWVLLLLLTAYLTDHIAWSLERQASDLRREHARAQELNEILKRQQKALVQQEKMAALGQMAAGVAHEIANPLASMDSLLQLVRRRPDRFTERTTDQLLDQIERINQIVRQMTEFAHPDASGWERLPLNAVVSGALEMVRFDHRLRKITVDRDLDDEAGEILLMPRAIQQVLVNLIMNAADAMADVEEPTLRVATRRRDGWGIIEVSDNGHGIAPEHIAHVFEPFFTTKPVGHGTGLGLSISYTLIERHGGKCEVHSMVQEGTKFIVYLPVGGPEEGTEGQRDSTGC